MEVNLSPHFKRAYKKVPSYIKDDFDKKIVLFIKDPHHQSLKVHKLKGKYQMCLAFRLRNGYRVLFEFSAPGVVDLLDIGPHDIYTKALS